MRSLAQDRHQSEPNQLRCRCLVGDSLNSLTQGVKLAQSFVSVAFLNQRRVFAEIAGFGAFRVGKHLRRQPLEFDRTASPRQLRAAMR